MTVTIEPYDFDLQIGADPSSITVPDSTVVEATVNRSLNNTGYRIHLIDDDGESSEATCDFTPCPKLVTAPWSVNPNPTARHFHAEVRSFVTGHLAATSEEFTVVRRRFLFDVDLDMEQQTEGDWQATATTNRDVNGTDYQLKITRLGGNDLCSTSSGTTCGPRGIGVGNTYRAVVENSNGHVAGQSAAWTLTDSGPQKAAAGDVDLAALAAASGSIDICARLALSPFKTDVVGPSTSAGDQWEACAAAAAAGAGTVAILLAVADTPGGEANLWWLQGDLTKEVPPPETEPNSDDAKAPRPVPPPFLPDVQKLADRLTDLNDGVDEPTADDVANQCRFLHWRAGRSPDRCSSLPIFASGSDVAEATEHDLRALDSVGYVPWLLLNRELSSTKPGDGWQTTGGRCTTTELRACHEYPFFGTEQGGPLAYKRGPEPLIGLVLKHDNSLQGTRYSQFISVGECNMQTGTPDPAGQENSTGGDPFLSIPLPPEWERPTLWLCNGKSQ